MYMEDEWSIIINNKEFEDLKNKYDDLEKKYNNLKIENELLNESQKKISNPGNFISKKYTYPFINYNYLNTKIPYYLDYRYRFNQIYIPYYYIYQNEVNLNEIPLYSLKYEYQKSPPKSILNIANILKY